jgi:ATP-dependent Clp protease ATP-binding subunit ClpX
VAKLMAGANAYICDACVGACNKILEATPATFAGWDKMTDDQLVSALKPAAATVDATREVLQAIVDNLRGRGVSWSVGRIG